MSGRFRTLLRTLVTSADPSGSEGALYFNSTSKKLRVHDGTAWREVTGDHTHTAYLDLVSAQTLAAAKTFTPPNTTSVPVTVKGLPSQVANLAEIRDGTNALVARLDPAGRLAVASYGTYSDPATGEPLVAPTSASTDPTTVFPKGTTVSYVSGSHAGYPTAAGTLITRRYGSSDGRITQVYLATSGGLWSRAYSSSWTSWLIGGLPDDGWTSLSGVAATGWTIDAGYVQYRTWGKTCGISVMIKRTGSTLTGSSQGNIVDTDVLTMPSAARPSRSVYGFGYVAGSNGFGTASITTGGVVQLETLTPTSTISSGDYIRFDQTYLI